MQPKTETLAALLRSMADPTRLAICRLLAREELCICHLQSDLGLSQALASHHVKVLRDAGLLDWRQHSYWTYYRLRPDALAVLRDLLGELAEAANAPAEPRACETAAKPVHRGARPSRRRRKVAADVARR